MMSSKRGYATALACLTSLAFPALAAAQGSGASAITTHASAAARAGRLALAIALGFLVIGVPLLAFGVRGAWWLLIGRRHGGRVPGLWWGRSLVVGEDNRVSTSKTAALVWTYSVAAALLSFLIARWMGHSTAFHVLTAQGLNAEYAVLIGGPLGAAILAKGIVSSQVASGAAAKTTADSPSAADLVQNDAGEADLGDVQYVLFNLVALVFFYGELLRQPQLGMPRIPDVLLGLTSLSAVGFVGKKALSGPAGISSIEPNEAHVGDEVTIATAGIIQDAGDSTGVTVRFGNVRASPGTMTVTTTTTLGVLIGVRVPEGATGQVDVTVSVPKRKPSTWPGFKIIPRITPGQNLMARPGHAVTLHASGVDGLGAQNGALRVTIGGQPATTKLNAGDVEVTVPARADPGPATLVLATSGGRDETPITVIE